MRHQTVPHTPGSPAQPDLLSAEVGRAHVPPYLSEHRQRLRERFLAGGADAMPDYELLELALFRAVPRQNVKPLAHRLLSHFGDLNNVFAATPKRLKEVEGVGPAVAFELKLIEALAHRMARGKVLKRQIISSWDAVLDYCKTVMSNRDIEQLRVLFLDTKNTLIADELLSSGTVNHTPVYPREIMKRALELNASALILVHNHPSGDAAPSDADIVMTKEIKTIGSALGINLHDHLIIGAMDPFSFRSRGLI